GAEVDAELPGGLARLGEVLDLHDPADADVDLGEVVEGDGVAHGRSVPKRKDRSAVLRPPLWPTSSARTIDGERGAVARMSAPWRAVTLGSSRIRRPYISVPSLRRNWKTISK